MKQEYSGYESFKTLYEKGVIVNGTVIKLGEGHKNCWEEGMFMVNELGDLESMAQSEPPYKAELVLSPEYSPSGWEIKD